MKKRVWFVGAFVFGLVVVLALAAGWWLLGEARYHPGAVAASARAGLSMNPQGPLKEGTLRSEGTREWSLEVEPGITIRGLVRGEGSPVVVIHGGPGFPPEATWAGLDAFSARHRFWYPHQRGCGWSDRPVDRFPTSDFSANLPILDAKLGLVPQIADIERLRRTLGVERIDLVGHSFGGLLACLYAVEFPDHVGKILLIAPAALVKFPPASGGLYEEIRKGLPIDQQAEYQAWLKDFFDYSRLFLRSEADLQKLNSGVIPFYRTAAKTSRDGSFDTNPALAGGWMMQAMFFSMGQRHDWTPAFARIQAPVTLVYGDDDLSRPDDFEAYAAVPHLKIEKISGGNHFVASDASFSASDAVKNALQ